MSGPFFLSPPTSTLHPQQVGPAFHPRVSHSATTLGRQGTHSALGWFSGRPLPMQVLLLRLGNCRALTRSVAWGGQAQAQVGRRGGKKPLSGSGPWLHHVEEHHCLHSSVSPRQHPCLLLMPPCLWDLLCSWGTPINLRLTPGVLCTPSPSARAILSPVSHLVLSWSNHLVDRSYSIQKSFSST